MEVSTNNPSVSTIDPNVVDESESKIKQKLGAARRRIKQIDLRQTVIDNPFTAVGIGLAAGALVGLVRAKPERGRVTSALISVAGMLAYRFLKDTAVAEIGHYARGFIAENFAENFKSDERNPRDVSPPF